MSLAKIEETRSAQEDPRWLSVLERRPGPFFYAVKTTGVFCRPGCPSRTPKRENVVFFDAPVQAEAAGYRACERCHPKGKTAAEASAEAVAKACKQIEQADEAPTLAVLAADAGMSPFHFHRQFKSVTGLTPKAYADALKGKRMRAELAEPDASVTAAIYGAGFGSSSRFYEKSAQVLGMTPTAFKRGGEDEEIRFAVGDCSLGAILVASSAKGVCAISLGDDPEQLVRDLQDRFPKARLIGGDAEFERLVARVVGFVEAPGLGLDLPLDVRGAAFEERVWRALREIPAGETASYGQIARAIGKPSAARAVARACAANPLAVVIPCHRVVKGDGSISGYRWGVERKQALLAREQAK